MSLLSPFRIPPRSGARVWTDSLAARLLHSSDTVSFLSFLNPFFISFFHSVLLSFFLYSVWRRKSTPASHPPPTPPPPPPHPHADCPLSLTRAAESRECSCRDDLPGCAMGDALPDQMSGVSDQNGVSPPHIMLEIHHSGREPSNFALLPFKRESLLTLTLLTSMME